MEITIVGAGNAGLAPVAMISKEWHKVTILKTIEMYMDSFSLIKDNQGNVAETENILFSRI